MNFITLIATLLGKNIFTEDDFSWMLPTHRLWFPIY